MLQSLKWLAFFAATGCCAFSIADDSKPKPPRPRLTLSREVTYFTEPLDKDGLIDYAAALNKKYGEGVTPENNAAVLYVRAMGPGDMDEADFHALCDRLGIEHLPMKGNYFKSLATVAQELRVVAETSGPDIFAEKLGTTLKCLNEQLARDPELWERLAAQCRERPWDAKNHPLVAGWIKTNEKALDTIVAASRREKCHFPLVTGAGFEALFSGYMGHLIDATRALAARAMLRARSGEAGAWNDVLAIRRMALQSQQGPTLVNWLIGGTIVQFAYPAAANMAHADGISLEEIRTMQTSWRLLGKSPSLAEPINNGERAMSLEALNLLVRSGAHEDAIRGNVPPPSVPRRILMSTFIDWEESYRLLNRQFDELYKIAAMPAGEMQDKAYSEWEEKLEKLSASRTDYFRWFSAFTLDFEGRRKAMGRLIGNLLVTMMMPALGAVHETERQIDMQAQFVEVAFSLARYRATKGSYPEKLDDIVPYYLAKVPADMYGKGPIRYRREATGFVLYSIGRNEKDDRGQNENDTAQTEQDAILQEDTDDMAIRVHR